MSWQVTGVRKDKFANTHRIIPVVKKNHEEKGKYLHPAEWSQPENKGIDFLRKPQLISVKNEDKSR